MSNKKEGLNRHNHDRMSLPTSKQTIVLQPVRRNTIHLENTAAESNHNNRKSSVKKLVKPSGLPTIEDETIELTLNPEINQKTVIVVENEYQQPKHSPTSKQSTRVSSSFAFSEDRRPNTSFAYENSAFEGTTKKTNSTGDASSIRSTRSMQSLEVVREQYCCCAKRTRLERRLLTTVTILVIIIAVLVTVVIIMGTDNDLNKTLRSNL